MPVIKRKQFEKYDNSMNETYSESVDLVASLEAQAKEEEKGIKDYDDLINASSGNDYLIRRLNDIRNDELRHVEHLHELVKNNLKDPYAEPKPEQPR